MEIDKDQTVVIRPDLNPGKPMEVGTAVTQAKCEVTGGMDGNDATDSREKHFSTSHLLSNLRRRTISSGLITLGAQATQFTLNMGSIMILARMLSPHDFGLLAMVATVLSFLRIFKDAGLSTPTIQREGITHAQVSNLFWINLSLSAAMGLIVALSGPAIAWFYREPRLTWIAVALSLTFVLEGSMTQHLAILNRQMRFTALAAIQISSMLAGIIVGIVMAWNSCGYWSLVGLQLTTPLVSLILVWSLSQWRPQRPTRATGTRSLITLGINLAASGFIWTLARSTDGLLIGRYFGSASLGLYSRASILLHRPVEQLLGPIEAVFLPMFCRIQSEPERYRRTFLQICEAVALASFFFTGLILALASPITLVVLGRKWAGAIPIFSSFTIGAVFLPLSWASTWLFVSQGRGKDWLIANSIVSSLAICSMLVGLPFGPVGIALAYSLAGVLVLLPIMYYFAGRSGSVTTSDLWMATLKHCPVWVVVLGATSLFRGILLSNFAPIEQLMICAPFGLLVGVGFIFAYAPSRRVALYLRSTLRENHAGAS